MASEVSAKRARSQALVATGGRIEMPSPGTLQRMEDPRAWHARGEVGIQAARRPGGAGTEAMTLPMAPPLPKSRPVPAKKTVLEEEEYVERLGEIIEGDYFPHNAKMYRALSGLSGHGHGHGNTPSHTPTATPSSMIGGPSQGGSTPGREGGPGDRGSGSGGEAGAGSSSKDAGTGGALTKFVATHTSEDNQAFAELQEKDQEAFRRRYFWAYDTTPDGEGNNATSTKLLILPNGKMMSVERREQMDAACADRPKIGDHRPNQVETWKHRTRNQLMFSPNMEASNDICRIEQAPGGADPLLLKDRTSGFSAAAPAKRIKQSGEAARRGAPAASAARGEGSSTGVESAPSDSLGVAVEGRSKTTSSSGEVSREAGAAGVSAGILEGAGPSAGGAAEDSSGCPQSQRDDDPAPATKDPPPPPPSRAARGTVVVKTNPKVIQAHATRFPVPEPRQPRRGPWASPIEKPSSSRESVAELLAGTANTPDYEEVPMTPSRVPGVDGDSPQITWGSIDGTPMILDPRATPLPGGGGDGSASGGAMDVAGFIGALGGITPGGHQFEIKELPARDKIAHRLEAVDTRRKRAKLGVGAAADGRGTHTPAGATPLTPRTTPGTGKRTPGTIGRRTPGGAKAPRGKSSAAAPSTPAARALAAKLAQRQSAATPFGGGLTPGRQRKRSSRTGSGGAKGGGLTPLPSTPARSATPVATANAKLGKRSSLTDGLLALK